MRGAMEAPSSAWARAGMGKCNWNELATPDHASANAFYEELLGWTYPDKMSIGPGRDYVFVEVGDQRIGATMQREGDQPAGWLCYLRVPNIDEAGR